jgi:flagellar assembly protein FliH
MSSSKVFKGDTLFTPHSLIRQSIPPPPREAKPSIPAASRKEPEQPAAQEGKKPSAEQDPSKQPSEPPAKPAPKPDPKPAPKPEPPPQPPVDIEAIRREAYKQGEADLSARLQADFDLAMQSLATACQKIDDLREQKLAGSRSDLINLVISLTEKILVQELASPRNFIAGVLQSALEQAITSEEFHVTLHPDDLAFAEQKAPELITTIRGLQQLVFKADPAVRRGGCLLESVACTVDATIDGQLESIREILEDTPEIFAADGEATPPPLDEAPGEDGT